MFAAAASGKLLSPQLHAFLSAPASGGSLRTPVGTARGHGTGLDAQSIYSHMLQPKTDPGGSSSQIVAPRLAPTQTQQQSDIESWLYAADAVNNVLQCARQQYSLAVGRIAAAGAVAAAGAGPESNGLESVSAPQKPFFAAAMSTPRPRDMRRPRDGG